MNSSGDKNRAPDGGLKIGNQLLTAAEQALAAGNSARAFELVLRATETGVDSGNIYRLASVFALAGRFQNRHADVLRWIEGAIQHANDSDPAWAGLLRSRVAVCRQLDLERVLGLAEDALAAAERAEDEEAYAGVLSHAAFAGYRCGNPRVAVEFAARAAARSFDSAAAHYDAVRAQLFAANAIGDLEAGLNLATKARAMAREQARPADVANESNNLAEFYLELGYPIEALRCAQAAVDSARDAGHVAVELFGKVLIALATAECGDIDDALDMFRLIGPLESNRIFAVDTATVHAFWLLERGAAGDAGQARDVAAAALSVASSAGVKNRMTGLHCNIARALAREGKDVAAGEALERARRAADHAEPRAHSFLALAVAEVTTVSSPKRKVVLLNERARILRTAGHREDPRAYCNRVRLNRRILDLSGGVPDDLPDAA